MSRVSTARSRAAKREAIAREIEFFRGLRTRVDSTAGQLALVGALVVVLLLTAWIEGH